MIAFRRGRDSPGITGPLDPSTRFLLGCAGSVCGVMSRVCLCAGGWAEQSGVCVCVCVGGRRERGGRGEQRGGWGSSAELAEGPATRGFVMRLGVRLPAFPLWWLVVNIRRRPREVVGIVLHHLQLGLDGSDLGAGAGVGRTEDRQKNQHLVRKGWTRQ